MQNICGLYCGEFCSQFGNSFVVYCITELPLLLLLFQSNIMDRFNPIFLEFSVTYTEPSIPMGNGNLSPTDFSNNPVLSFSGNREVQVIGNQYSLVTGKCRLMVIIILW